MAENNLSSKEQMIYDYMKELMKLDFPDADLSDTGAFMEMFGKPHIDLLTPVIEFADRVALVQSVDNAKHMTTEEMDRFAKSKYMYRQSGERAIGFVNLIFSDIPVTGTLVIPADTSVVSKQGYTFRSMQSVTLTESQLVDYYDPSTFRYVIPVQFEAEDVGDKYNVKEGDITTIGKDLKNLVAVYNDTPFDRGVNAETNEELAERIKESSMSKNMGVVRGYKGYMKGFKEVKDVVVAGYGHPLMKRDIIGTFPKEGFFNQTVRDLHWGTKVDIYLRGQKLQEYAEYLKVVTLPDSGKYGVYLSKKPVHDIVDIKLYTDIGQLDDPNIDESTLLVTEYALEKDEDSETVGTLNETAWVVLNDERINSFSNVRVRYRYNSLIEEIHGKMYDENERPPTADVLLKEANKKYVFGSLKLKMKSPIGLRERDRSLIRQKAYAWADEVKMGEEIQFSDISTILTQTGENGEEALVDYIKMPFQFFVSENNGKYIFYAMSQEQKKVTDQFLGEKIFLHEVIQKYKDNVTIYDVFDLLHTFTFESGLDKALDSLEYEGFEWGQKTQFFKLAKKMVVQSLIPTKLSPARSTTNENEYFELGDMYVYEDKEYSSEDWKSSIDLLYNIASVGNENFEPKDILQLAVYCITVLYLLTAQENLSDDRSGLYQYLIELVGNTPISYEFDR